MPDPYTQAWEEAEASPDPQVAQFNTLEIQHASFAEPARVVANVSDDLVATLEDDAAFNAGEAVTFTACTFTSELPELAEGKPPECLVTIDNVARLLVPQLNAAVAVIGDLTVVWRQYLSDDLSAPSYGPVEFTVRQAKMRGTAIQGTARVADLANRKFPGLLYTVNEFPGLLPE